MSGFGRYELVDTIAAGDFATVWRARDRELGREVAIKQIHPQFLHDERQLARYWQEAQLLASLQHPHVLTVYDIVRSRGWLILELMRGSLRQAVEAGPLDLDFLRVTIVSALSALHFLHANGVVHGDVKPSNLMVDAQNRVKLGDFGLARRATSDEGSLLKGTTKYMAPELLSPQFGAVGPAADLYSLGFSAFELMCGPEFESLFPGLSTFGRDKQIAWMMWHAAPDRHLPQISQVLQGVPPDLAHVIQRLVQKDQALRYTSARDAIEDLRAHRMAAKQPEAPPAAAPAPRPSRRRRLLAIGAFALSLTVVLGFLLLDRRSAPKTRPEGPPALRGVVREVWPEERRLSLESSDDGRAIELRFRTEDRIFVNGKSRLLYDLRRGDRLEAKLDPLGRFASPVQVTREETGAGLVTKVSPESGQIVVQFTEGEGRGRQQAIEVPSGTKIVFNGRETVDDRPTRLADLRPGDRVEVAHLAQDGVNKAVRLSVQRVVGFHGVLRKIDRERGLFSFALAGAADPAPLVTLPVADPCDVTLNNQRSVQERIVQPADLKEGDEVDVQHDTKIVRMDARRVYRVNGTLTKLDTATRLMELIVQGRNAPSPFLAAAACSIELSGTPARLDDLRAGDVVEVSFDTPEARLPEAKAILARRPADPQRVALILAGESYDDASVSPLPQAAADTELLRAALVDRYRTAPDRVLVLASESLVRLEQGIPRFLAGATPDTKLIVYVIAQAYRDDDGQVYIAPKTFDSRRIAASGLRLQWLVDQLEQCPAGEKLLLLDACHAGDGADLARQPSSAEMIRTIQPPSPGLAPLRTLTAIASCAAGQRGLLLSDGKGLFASCLASGYGGAADANRDTHIEPTELLAYLQQSMPAAAKLLNKEQTPVLFLPDARPPRLSADARKAIHALAAFLPQTRFDKEKVDLQYVTAEQLAGKEVEPKLLYGLLLLKGKRRDEAARIFEEVNLDRPGNLTAGQALAWIHFDRLACQAGVDALTGMVSQIKPPRNPADPISEDLRRVFAWAGQLREFGVSAVLEGRRASEPSASKLDMAVAAQGDQAQQAYEQGRAKSRATLADLGKQIDFTTDDATAARLRVQRRQLLTYANFPFDEAADRVLAGLDH